MRTQLYLSNFEQEYWCYVADMAGKEDALNRLNAVELVLIRYAQAQTALSHDAVVAGLSKSEKNWLLLAVFSGLAVFAFINRGILQPVAQKKLANSDGLVTVLTGNEIPRTNTINGINTELKPSPYRSGRMSQSKTKSLIESAGYIKNQSSRNIFSQFINTREPGFNKSSLPALVDSIFLLPRQRISTANNKQPESLERRFQASASYDRQNRSNSVAKGGSSLVSAAKSKYFSVKHPDNTGIARCLKPLIFVSGTTLGNKTQLLADITLLKDSLTRLQLNINAAKRKPTVNEKNPVDNNQSDQSKNKPAMFSEKSAELRLPFKPLAVDWFNHEAVLGVRYKGSYAYLHHGQVFKGWKLIRINENEIIFESKISGIKRILY